MKKKKRKFKLKIFILTIIILGIGWFLIFAKTDREDLDNPYNLALSEFITDESIIRLLTEREFSKTVERALLTNNFIYKHAEEYFKIDYVEKENFFSIINTLLDLGYCGDDVNYILTLKPEDITIFKNEFIDLSEFRGIRNFEAGNIARYHAFRVLNPTLSMADVVTRVNIGLDRPFYTNIREVEDPYSITVLVNKFKKLPSNFSPSDLINVPGQGTFRLRREASENIVEMLEAARRDGHIINIWSAYRSYSAQTRIYNNFVSRYGREAADTFSARPGHSEHQTGLSADLGSGSSTIINIADQNWLINNAHRFGFIVRYTESGVPITGYMSEPWHVRYVGVRVATNIFNRNITFDEYWDLYLK